MGLEECTRLAREGANKPVQDVIPLEIPKEFDLHGAKLATLTQATAYQGIRQRQKPPSRQTTRENLNTARNAIHTYNGNLETDASIWIGNRNSNICTRVQQYLYKSLNATQMVGNIWMNIPTDPPRQNCTTCHVTETMEHILIHCAALLPPIIWDLARSTWPYARCLWPEISFGIVLGCGSVYPPTTELPNRTDPPLAYNPRGVARLLQILISESAHLIWVLRCERVIQDRSHTAGEIRLRWLRSINARLTDDKILATMIKHDEKHPRR